MKRESAAGGNFILGAVAGFGSSLWIHPLDLIKNRMQVSGECGQKALYKNAFHCARSIIRLEGVTGFYYGVSASVARQLSYTTVRLGLYNSLLQQYKIRNNVKSAGVLQTIVMGGIAGGIGAFCGNPCDVVLVRMTVDKRLPIPEQRGYSSIFNAWSRIIKDEGVASLWTGCRPTIARAMIVNASQLSVNTQAKYALNHLTTIENVYLLSIMSSCISGFVTTCIVLPIDIAKTRMQSMNKTCENVEYKGWMDVWRRTVKSEGFGALWKGFGPYFLRTPMTLFLMDVLLYQYKK